MATEKKAEGTVPELAKLTAEQIQKCLVLGASFEQIKDMAEAGFGYDQILSLARTLGSAKSAGAGLSAGDLRQILLDQRKAMKPENDRHPGISAFNPEGDRDHPKPGLVRKTYFNGIPEDHDALTPLEIDLYNRFTMTRTARQGMWKAEVLRNGSAEELWISTEPKTLDGRQSLPKLTMLLRELLDGAAAADPDTLAKRVAELEAKIAAHTQVSA